MKPRTPRRKSGRTRSTPPAPASPRRQTRAASSQQDTARSAELRALRLEIDRAAAQTKEVLQKLERLTLMVGELRGVVADLQASLGDGDVEYGTVDETDSEMGEGHA